MNFKHLYQGSAFLLLGTITLLQSCLGSNESEYELSSDAQIYSFSATASYDSTNVLSTAVFAIDPLVIPNPKIYPRDSLAYLFEVKNALVDLATNGASAISIYLNNPDSNYFWNSTDSIDLSRLVQIEVYAMDGETKKAYDFEIYSHQQDPDTLIWRNIKTNYITPSSIDVQKTIRINNQFITYYLTGTTLNATASVDGATWNAVSTSGLSANVRLGSLLVEGGVGYVTDENNDVYKSVDGVAWNLINAERNVRAIYGRLPSVYSNSLLAVVEDGAQLKFATTEDFVSFNVVNAIPDNFPVDNFSHLAFEATDSYMGKQILVAGGTDADGAENNRVWVVQEKDEEIGAISRTPLLQTAGASLFVYEENRPYMLTAESITENALVRSDDSGLSWSAVPSKQQLPNEFLYRQNASVIADEKNYIWIFGGVSGAQSQISDVWRGRLNKLAVD